MATGEYVMPDFTHNPCEPLHASLDCCQPDLKDLARSMLILLSPSGKGA